MITCNLGPPPCVVEYVVPAPAYGDYWVLSRDDDGTLIMCEWIKRSPGGFAAEYFAPPCPPEAPR